MANVSKSISIPNDDFLDDTTPSVARKFLNEVKITIVTLQRVVKHRMTIETHNWSSSAHQELHKILRDEIFPIVNQVDSRVQNFEIQFLKEAAKFVGDFKSLAKEADESLAKHKALELEIERLLKVVVSQDIMNIVQKESVVDTSYLQTELERTKEHFENCIIKKETEYAKLWNDWYKKCDECKYDKISYDKAYKDMQQNIEWLQAQLGDLKGQFCDFDLEVAFRRDACFVKNLEGVDLLKGDRSTKIYTINLQEMASASPICLMARASSTKSWLWHQRLSHLNFDTINDLARHDLVAGLPKFKYHKEHLCPSCEQGKSKRASHPPKPVPNSRQRLHLLHMDLCGPMRIASINGKRYVLVIVDDYSRYTWVHFLRSKDEAPEAIATACFTQNHSIIHQRFNKTPYELINGRKPDISFLHVFGALCYPKNDREDIGKLGFIDVDHPSHVYKLKKALYGLKQAPRLGRLAEIKDKLDIDHNGTPDSGFELTGFSDANYAGCKDTFKSTSGGAQFLGKKLVSWSSKTQDCMALSTAEAEYVSLSACCA
nr:retrovirus-related Pol polyprotein from transposon TNT 1-94 [Tanacetum cinerariifolium]